MASHAANAKLLQRMNERTVLESIRGDHPISRAEIARRLGLSKPTVSTALQVLLDAGLVREAKTAIYPNYGAVFFEPNFDAAHVLAFDVGARFLRGAVCDLSGEVRARADIDVFGQDAETIMRRARKLREELLAGTAANLGETAGAVLGVPGVVDHGERITLGNLPGLDGLTVPEIQEWLGVAVQVENDINLAALGERWQGVGQGAESFAYFSIGTGFGAGFILDGRLHRGRHGAAGEMEYVGADRPEDDLCAWGLGRYATEMAATGRYSTRLKVPYEPIALFAAAREGDELGLLVVEEEVRRIARYVGAIAAIADVELVVLGGGIGANEDLLLEPLRAALAARLPYPPAVQTSSLGETAVVMGALSLGLETALETVVDWRLPPVAAIAR